MWELVVIGVDGMGYCEVAMRAWHINLNTYFQKFRSTHVTEAKMLLRSVALNYYISLMGSVRADGYVVQAMLALLPRCTALGCYSVIQMAFGIVQCPCNGSDDELCTQYAFQAIHLCTLTIEIYCKYDVFVGLTPCAY